MPRPRVLRRSKLRESDDDDTHNMIGGWPREQLVKMNERFATALWREMSARNTAGERALCGHDSAPSRDLSADD